MLPASNIDSQINTGMGMGSNTPWANQGQQQQFYIQNTYNPDFMPTLPGMDFLNNMSNAAAGDGDDNPNFDTGALGDLGFGKGLDFSMIGVMDNSMTCSMAFSLAMGTGTVEGMHNG